MANYSGTFYIVVHIPPVSLPGTRKSMNAEAWMFSFWLFGDVIKSRLKHDSSYLYTSTQNNTLPDSIVDDILSSLTVY